MWGGGDGLSMGRGGGHVGTVVERLYHKNVPLYELRLGISAHSCQLILWISAREPAARMHVGSNLLL